jgi:hypothetical protein
MSNAEGTPATSLDKRNNSLPLLDSLTKSGAQISNKLLSSATPYAKLCAPWHVEL